MWLLGRGPVQMGLFRAEGQKRGPDRVPGRPLDQFCRPFRHRGWFYKVLRKSIRVQTHEKIEVLPAFR